MISVGERDRRAIAKQRDRDLRKRARARLRELAVAIRAAKQARKAKVGEIRSTCRVNRSAYREQIAQARAELRRLIEQKRAEVARCKTAPREARAQADRMILEMIRELADERQLQAELRRAEGRAGKTRITISEKRAEDDDAVRGNLDPELVPIFDRVRTKIRATPRMSRTEAFLQWAHDNAGEVARMQAEIAEAAAEAEFRAAMRQEQDLRRAMRRGSSRAIARALEDEDVIPF